MNDRHATSLTCALIAVLALSGCALNWTDYESALAASDMHDAILLAGQPAVTEAIASVTTHDDVFLTITLTIDELAFDEQTLCHAVAAAVEEVPFRVDRLAVGLLPSGGGLHIDTGSYFDELDSTTSELGGRAVLDWADAEALANRCS